MAEIFTKIKERILQIPDNKGIAKEKFFEQLGLSYANFKGKSKKSAIGAGALVEISTQFPEINLEWLITGKGEMIKQEQPPAADSEELIKLKEENSKLKDKVIALLEENTLLKDETATKSNKHTAPRPVSGKLTP